MTGTSSSPRRSSSTGRTTRKANDMRLNLTTLSLAAALAFGVIPALAAPGGHGADKGQFTKTFTGPDSFAAQKAIEALDPDLDGDFELLKMVLQSGSWYHRTAAANRLAKTGNDK